MHNVELAHSTDENTSRVGSLAGSLTKVHVPRRVHCQKCAVDGVGSALSATQTSRRTEHDTSLSPPTMPPPSASDGVGTIRRDAATHTLNKTRRARPNR